jgi:hypothetical protein
MDRMNSGQYTGAALAYQDGFEKKAASKIQILKVMLVGGDCLLIGIQPILVHMSKDANGRFAYSPVSVNFLTEVAKCVFAIALLVYYANKPGPEGKALR